MTKAKFGYDLAKMWELLHAELTMGVKERRCKELSVGIEGKLYCVEPTSKDGLGSWCDLGLYLSLNLPGQFWVGSSSLCWSYNKQSLYMCVENRLEGIKEARAIVHKLTGEPFEKIPCSAAGCARKMLEWVNITQIDGRALDSIGACTQWAYQYCQPIDLPQAYLWDVTSCYYSLLCRAPSPKVILLQGKLKWCSVSFEEMARWKAMLKAAGPHKGIRNSFIGQMYSRSNGTFYSNGKSNKREKEIELLRAEDGVTLYQTGLHLDAIDEHLKEEEDKPMPGPLRPLACLIVRSAYELCALAAFESKAIYSNTDCVITTQAESPSIWAKYGLKVKLKGSGATNVHSLGFYRCGEESTKPYKDNESSKLKPRIPFTEGQENLRMILTGKRWSEQWLKVDPGWKEPQEETTNETNAQWFEESRAKIKAENLAHRIALHKPVSWR